MFFLGLAGGDNIEGIVYSVETLTEPKPWRFFTMELTKSFGILRLRIGYKLFSDFCTYLLVSNLFREFQ